MPILEFLYLAAENWSADGFLAILYEKQKISFKNIFSESLKNTFDRYYFFLTKFCEGNFQKFWKISEIFLENVSSANFDSKITFLELGRFDCKNNLIGKNNFDSKNDF